MKHKLLLGSLTLFFILIANFAQGQAKVEFVDSSVYDFGEVYMGDSAIHYFNFINTGNKQLIIDEVKTTCSCTASDWPRYPIPPNGKGSIRVKFDTNQKDEGMYAKGVNMYSNAGETNMIIYITIKRK